MSYKVVDWELETTASADGTITLKTPKVDEGFFWHVYHVAARGNAGSENELTRLGYIFNQQKRYLKSGVTTTTDRVFSLSSEFCAPVFSRVFAEWEAANDGETLVLVVNAVRIPIGDKS